MPESRDEILSLLASIPLQAIRRIDLGLEGDWSRTVVPVWSRQEGRLGFEDATRSHREHRPSLELYFDGAWVGIHSFRRDGEMNVFDERFADEVIRWVESELG